MEKDKPASETSPNEALREPTSKVSELLEKAAGTSAAAKLSGAFHETAGRIKQKVGEISDRPAFKDLRADGRREELLGKVHAVVGELRGIRELADKELRGQAARLLDSATAFLEELKKKL